MKFFLAVAVTFYISTVQAETCPALDGKPTACNQSRNAGAVSLPTISSGHHEIFCENEWTRRGVLDRSMFRYCLQRQREGYKNLAFLSQKHKNIPDLQAVVDRLAAKWTKRDARNDELVAYELDREIESYLDIEYEKKQRKYDYNTFNDCQSEFGKSEWSMISYCYKQKMHIGNN